VLLDVVGRKVVGRAKGALLLVVLMTSGRRMPGCGTTHTQKPRWPAGEFGWGVGGDGGGGGVSCCWLCWRGGGGLLLDVSGVGRGGELGEGCFAAGCV
jgi:hypothetical protein